MATLEDILLDEVKTSLVKYLKEDCNITINETQAELVAESVFNSVDILIAKHCDYKELQVCDDCGSSDVSVDCWVNLNTNEHNDGGHEYYCGNCDSETSTSEVDSYAYVRKQEIKEGDYETI